MRVKHNLEPVYSNHSKTLILGSMPSQESRRIGKYYGHKSNRFWRILEELYDEKIEDWKDFIIRHDLALWDVIGECDIKASSDASIKNTRLNDIKSLITKTQIENIFYLAKVPIIFIINFCMKAWV